MALLMRALERNSLWWELSDFSLCWSIYKKHKSAFLTELHPFFDQPLDQSELKWVVYALRKQQLAVSGDFSLCRPLLWTMNTYYTITQILIILKAIKAFWTTQCGWDVYGRNREQHLLFYIGLCNPIRLKSSYCCGVPKLVLFSVVVILYIVSSVPAASPKILRVPLKCDIEND